MRTILTLAAVFVVEPLFGFDAANAGPCIDQISQIEHVMQQPKVRPLAQQAVVAQLHHQPTPQSVENAAEKGRAEVGALLARAKVLDAEGSAAECMSVVSKLKIQLGPGAAATGGQLQDSDETVRRGAPRR
jgi:type IV secretory pathway VirJ component